jgi:hypothetical protein
VGAERACLGTYNPLPKSLHNCDRRNYTSGGAEVERRSGPSWAAVEASVGSSQHNRANAAQAEKCAHSISQAGRGVGLRST